MKPRAGFNRATFRAPAAVAHVDNCGMSFARDARTVRDTALPLVQREAALGRCVRRFAPFGLLGTFEYLARHTGHTERPGGADRLAWASDDERPGGASDDELAAGGRDPAERLIAAIGLLESSRAAWRNELERFAATRRLAKARGQRRIVAAEIEPYSRFGWPGANAADTGGQPLAPQFLHRYGLVLWQPAPVNLRRAVRRATRARKRPARFDGCLPSLLIFVEGLIGVMSWLIFHPPAFFWYGFILVSTAALLYSIIEGYRQGTRARTGHQRGAAAAAARRVALTERLGKAESRRS